MFSFLYCYTMFALFAYGAYFFWDKTIYLMLNYELITSPSIKLVLGGLIGLIWKYMGIYSIFLYFSLAIAFTCLAIRMLILRHQYRIIAAASRRNAEDTAKEPEYTPIIPDDGEPVSSLVRTPVPDTTHDEYPISITSVAAQNPDGSMRQDILKALHEKCKGGYNPAVSFELGKSSGGESVLNVYMGGKIVGTTPKYMNSILIPKLFYFERVTDVEIKQTPSGLYYADFTISIRRC